MELIFEICDPALTYNKIPGSIPTNEIIKNLIAGIFEIPNKILITKKGNTGTTLKKNR